MRNSDGLAALIGKAFWGLVVVDEAIIMKGRSSTSPKRLCACVKVGAMCILLSVDPHELLRNDPIPRYGYAESV